MKILLIEDNPEFAESIRNQLYAGGFECELCNDGKTGVSGNDSALILLSAALSGCNAISLCKELRAKLETPILLFAQKAEEADVIRGFSAGADDYITAPFSPAILLAKVKAFEAFLNRMQMQDRQKEKNLIRANGLVIDKKARRVFVNGEEVSMPVREFDLLLFLAENPNIVFSKERIFDRLWGLDAMGNVSTVTVHIQRIREKIKRDPSGREYIETVWSAGYRFRGETKI